MQLILSGHPLKIFWKQAPILTAGVGGSPLVVAVVVVIVSFRLTLLLLRELGDAPEPDGKSCYII